MGSFGVWRRSDATDASPPEPSTVEVGRRLTEVLRRAAHVTALPIPQVEPDTIIVLDDDRPAMGTRPDLSGMHPDDDPIEIYEVPDGVEQVIGGR